MYSRFASSSLDKKTKRQKDKKTKRQKEQETMMMPLLLLMVAVLFLMPGSTVVINSSHDGRVTSFVSAFTAVVTTFRTLSRRPSDSGLQVRVSPTTTGGSYGRGSRFNMSPIGGSDDTFPSDCYDDDYVVADNIENDKKSAITTTNVTPNGSVEKHSFMTATTNDDSSTNEDSILREELQRELLLLGSVTNRGEHIRDDEERNILNEIVIQLEALNPGTSNTNVGEWDLVITSTKYLLLSSPWFTTIASFLKGTSGNGRDSDSTRNVSNSIRTALLYYNKLTASAIEIGRVRQIITSQSSSYDGGLQVSSYIDIVPPFSNFISSVFSLSGTIVTESILLPTAASSSEYDIEIQSTKIQSNANKQLPDIALPNISSVLRNDNSLQQQQRITYIDDGLRITRDSHNKFFVYARS